MALNKWSLESLAEAALLLLSPFFFSQVSGSLNDFPHTFKNKGKYQNFSYHLQTGFSLVWNSGKITILLYSLVFPHGYTGTAFLIFAMVCCGELLLNCSVTLTFRLIDLSWLSSFFSTMPAPTTSPFQLFWYGLQSTFIDFYASRCLWETDFGQMGTASEMCWSFWICHLSPIAS